MLAMDPLMLLIKERAGETEEERKMASTLLPIVNQHHRLLVTLLLMNSIANEALPIFLEALVPPSVAILLSVTMVLFFGEIIPSAIFTGPNQLKLAHRLVPLVQAALFLLYPIAGPIAKILDHVLHDEDGDTNGYNRGELAALIRINYEQRLAQKRMKRNQRDSMAMVVQGERVGALDFTSTRSLTSFDVSKSMRATTSQLTRTEGSDEVFAPVKSSSEPILMTRSPSFHLDEVLMAEGALQMKTKVAYDVFTPLRKVFSVPIDMILSERNLVKIYASGYTRVPVHAADNKSAIIGFMLTKQLIVVDGKDKRPLSTLPLRTPYCVSPTMPLVNLLNLLQMGGEKGRGGHMALICARPDVGNRALSSGQEVPETAGLMGIVTLEDILEALLQEQIYDEMDARERAASRLARMVVKKWRQYVRSKKSKSLIQSRNDPALVSVVQTVIAKETADERTALL
jgi:metal transporter CNNM